MAGIGFQLRKLIGSGGLGQKVGALVSGLFIVAGPWMISVLSMIIMQWLMLGDSFAALPAFRIIIVYEYALSLSIFAGIHHHFTRIVADLAWTGAHGEATAWMVRFVVLVAALSVAVGIPAVLLMGLNGGAGTISGTVIMVILFVAINISWITMLYVSLLRDYRTISIVYAIAMAISVVLATSLARTHGLTGAIAGYAAGLLAMDVAFLTIGIKTYRPVWTRGAWKLFFQVARTYTALITSGLLFYAGQWMDKFYFWIARGTFVAGTNLRVYEAYDIQVYIAGLTVLPGLVYFTVIAETQIFVDLKHFLFTLNHSTWTGIRKARKRIVDDVRKELVDQSLLQAGSSLLLAALVIASGLSVGSGGIGNPVLWVAMTAAFGQFTLLSLLIYLYYFEMYRHAMVSALVYFALNSAGSVLLYSMFPSLLPGVSHCVAAAAACFIAYSLLMKVLYNAERLVFTKAAL